MIKFEVKMTDKIMYDFLLHHNYRHLSGIFGLFLGTFGLFVGIMQLINQNSTQALLGFLIAVLFWVIVPLSLRTNAKKQVLAVPTFKKPLEYEFTEEGMTIRQDEQEAFTQWDAFVKAESSRKSILLYTSRIRAIILPKECIGDSYDEFVNMLEAHLPAKKVKVKRAK